MITEVLPWNDALEGRCVIVKTLCKGGGTQGAAFLSNELGFKGFGPYVIEEND